MTDNVTVSRGRCVVDRRSRGVLQMLRLHALFLGALLVSLLLVFGPSSVQAQAANAADPRIVTLASSLGNSPATIHNYLRDQIAIEIYTGSLRGARGTLASMAGNSLDRASLGIALLRASGFNARYAQGSLAGNLPATLINRMLGVNPLRVLGCFNPRGLFPASDSDLLNAAGSEHFWIEYESSPGTFTAMDGSFVAATLGQTFATATQRFTDVPLALRHTVRLRLEVETFVQAAAAFGLGIGTTTVLDRSFDTVDLVDKPITLSHFLAINAPPALAIGAVITTYSPYLMVGDSTVDVNNYEVLRGNDYGEILTNFPQGNIVVTGVTLNIDSTDASGTTTTESRTLADRVGYAKRRSGASVALTTVPPTLPVLTRLDQMTIGINPGRQPLNDFASRKSRLEALQVQLSAIAPVAAALPPYALRNAAELAVAERATALTASSTTLINELAVASLAAAADELRDRNSVRFLVKAYQSTPRITIAATKVNGTSLQYSIDLRKNDSYVTVALNGISTGNPRQFRVAVGLAESVLEGEILSRVTGLPAVSIANVLSSATNAADFFPITSENRENIDDLNLSADAKARILAAVDNGRAVLAPVKPVLINGSYVTAWLETDPATGFTVSTFEDGTHGGIVEYVFISAGNFIYDGVQGSIGNFIGNVTAFGVVSIAFTAGILQSITSNGAFGNDVVGSVEQQLKRVMKGAVEILFGSLDDLGLFGVQIGNGGLTFSLIKGLYDGIKMYYDQLKAQAGDPPVPNLLFSMALPPLPTAAPPGTVPGVSVSVIPDTLFTSTQFGADFPGVYRVRITNTGPLADTFTYSTQTVSGYGAVNVPAPTLSIPAGATAEISACAVMYHAIPPVGAPLSFVLVVRSTTQPGVFGFTAPATTAPSIAALQMKILPTPQTKLPGTSGTATLTLDALGNQPVTATLSRTISPLLGVTGIPATVSMAAGESRSFPLNYTVSSAAAPGSVLSLDLRGEFGASYAADAQFGVSVTSTVTTCAAPVVLAAANVGRRYMEATLARLSSAMDRLAASPSDALRRLGVLANIDALLPQLNAAYINASVAPVISARAAVVAASPATMGAALASLDAALCGLNSAIKAAYNDAWRLYLSPAVATNLPTITTAIDVNIFNDASVPRTFDMSVLGVPSGTTAVFNRPTVTLTANDRTNSSTDVRLNLSFSNTDSAAKAFDYQVVATPRDDAATAKTTNGQLTLRSEIIRVASVSALPAYANPGVPIALTARLLNVVNRSQSVYLHYDIRNRAGSVVRSANSPFVTLNVGDNVVNVPLPTLNTTGLALGSYSVEVTVQTNLAVVPGAMGSTAILIGQPLGAALTATPSAVVPGNSTVDMAFSLDRQTALQPLLTLRTNTSMPSITSSFDRSNSLLYVCQRDRISIVDVSNPGAPAVLGSFGSNVLTPPYQNVSCNVYGSKLVVGFDLDTPTSSSTRKLVVFDIAGANATAPVQNTATPINLARRFGGGIVFNGTTGYMNTSQYTYNPFSQFIFQQNGNLLKLDFSTVDAPTLTGELFHHVDASDTNDPLLGGPNQHFGVPVIRGSTALVASSTSTLGDVGVGVGQIRVIDTTGLSVTSNCLTAPTPCLKTPVTVPQARLLFGIAGQGNAAIATGDTLGPYDAISGLIGNLTITALNITTPTAPTVTSTLVTSLTQRETSACNSAQRPGGATLTALTSNFYAASAFNPQSCSFVLALIDASDPANLRVIPYDVPDVLGQVILDGNVLYALTASSVVVFDYTTITGPSVVAKVDVPKGTGVAVVSGSFNVNPTSVVNGADRDTLIWNQPTASPLTWKETVSNMQPGTSRDVALGASIDFVVPGLGNGTLKLGPTTVTTNQAITISPIGQLVAVGTPATHTITLSNPSAAPVNYTLAVHGVPPSWVKQLTSPVSVAAGAAATSTLVLQTPISVGFAEFPFSVTATSDAAFSATVVASFTNYYYPDLGAEINSPTVSSPVLATPSPASGARGASTVVTLRVTNNGSLTENYEFVAQSFPANWFVSFDRGSTTVAPAGFVDVRATIDVPGNETAAIQNVVFRLLLADGSTRSDTTVPIAVSGNGVALSVNPTSGNATETYLFRVTNLGGSSDIFDLLAYGPLGGAVTLSASNVALAAGASTTVNATITRAASFTSPGSSSFDVYAFSRASTAARARATAQVLVAGELGMTALVSPSSVNVVSLPSSVTSQLLVTNTGNLTDSYSVTIISISGSATAAIRDASGAGVQTLSPLGAPAFALLGLTVDATLTDAGPAVVTLRVQSLTDTALFREVTLTLRQTQTSGPGAVVSLSAAALDFGIQTVGVQTTAQTVTVTNIGIAALDFTSINLAGAHIGDFMRAGSCTVGTPVAPNANCTLVVRFTPGAVGSRSASVVITSNAQNGAATLTLTGIGRTVAVRSTLDVDGDGIYDALTDGLLIMRWLTNASDPALANAAIGTNATRRTAADISAYLTTLGSLLDIDGNGQIEPLKDGVLILRYLFGFRGAALINGAVGANPARFTAADIEAYLRALTP